MAEAVPVAVPAAPTAPAAGGVDYRQAARDALLIGTGWFGTGMALKLHELPFQILMKESH